MDLEVVASVRAALWQRGGYRPVPIASFDDPDPVGAGKRPLHKDWPDRARRNPPEAATTPAQRHLANTGILADALRLIDVDINDLMRADAIEQLAINMLGGAPTRRRNNSNRFAMLYRAANGTPGKRRLLGTTGDAESRDQIEVLGKGQQFVAYGTHASGGEIYWTGPEPLDMPAAGLPAVTEEQITAFLAAAAEIIQAPKPKPERKAANGAAAGNGQAQSDLAPLSAALAALPAELADDYDTWILVGCALHHATRGADEGRDLWDEWSRPSAKYDATEIEWRWQSFATETDAKARAGTIFHLARQHGWAPPGPTPPPDWEQSHPAVTSILTHQRGARRKRRNDEAYAPADLETVWDPWENPPPPEWPEGILSPEAERALADVSLRDGVDLGALCMTILNAASAAAPKDARFAPYATDWAVPPIFWLMTVGESGTRKTLLDDFGFCVLRAVQAELWRPHNERMREWRRLPAKERGPKPEEPHSFIFNDYTPEALQAALGRTTRGSAIVKDELAGLLEFARYRKSGGETPRAFFLSAYEDKDCPVHRMSRDSELIEHTGLTIFGNIQPRRLAAFQENMETDGLLQRFIPLWVEPAKISRPEIRVGPGLAALYDNIRRLCRLDGRRYTTIVDGAQLIHDTEVLAKEYAALTDFGLGWPGFCYKLHGTHARLALILHLMEKPDVDIVPADTVHRAHRLVHRFVLQHAHDFYSALPGRGRSLSHDIANWLLTRGPADAASQEQERILASDLTAGVKACRPLGSKAIGEALDPFVTGGWLAPENDYPGNRAWLFDPSIRRQFAAQTQLAREQRAEARALVARIQAHRRKSP